MAQDSTQPKVMVVEDDRLLADMLKFLMEREGYDVLLAADGRQARRLIAESEAPSLVLLDVDLPYHDGYELIESIRTQDRWTHVPIIMLSSKGSERDIARAFDKGADDYIVRPFQPEELKARVRRRLCRQGSLLLPA